MLDLYRFIETSDVEDVTLKNRSDYKVLDSGMWVVPDPSKKLDGEDCYVWDRTTSLLTADTAIKASAIDAASGVVRLARMVWMEKGRTDARAVGKISTIRGGGVKAKTDIFDPTGIIAGSPLTIVKKAEALNPSAIGPSTEKLPECIMLKKAAPDDIVKAIALCEPVSEGTNKVLYFELVD